MLVDCTDWPADPAFADLFRVLAPDNVLRLAQRQRRETDRSAGGTWSRCQVIEALYDPGKHVRIAYALHGDHSIQPRRTWPEAEIIYVRYPVRIPMSRRGWVVTDRGFSMEFYRFPNDRRLRGLRKFTGRADAAALWQRWLNQDEPGLDLEPDSLRRALMRYVPEQKWIVQLRAQCRDHVAEETVKRAIAVRSADSESCRALYDRTLDVRRALVNTERGFRVPKPVALDHRLGLLAVQWMWGRSLLDSLLHGDPTEILGRVADALQIFHKAPIENLTPLDPGSYLKRAEVCAADIHTVLSALTPLVHSIIDSLKRHVPQGDASLHGPIHNDFHWNQLQLKRDRVTILDLERCAWGDPLVDVATFVTQLSVLDVRDDLGVTGESASQWAETFLRVWESTTGCQVHVGRLRWYSAVALLVLARGTLRHLRSHWPARTQRYLQRAFMTLNSPQSLKGAV